MPPDWQLLLTSPEEPAISQHAVDNESTARANVSLNNEGENVAEESATGESQDGDHKGDPRLVGWL